MVYVVYCVTSGKQEKVQACLVTLWLFIISCHSLYKTTLGSLCSWKPAWSLKKRPHSMCLKPFVKMCIFVVIVRRAGLLWSQPWFWVVMICPIIKCLTVLEFSFILFDLCLFITIFNFILNYVPIVTFRIFTYHKILILLIIFCFIWSYWIIYFLTCLEVFWSVVS